MPTYEYRCKTCAHQFDIVQSFSDDALTICDECGGELRKVFGSVGISFKGNGFYKNDSRGKTSSTSTAASTGDSSSSSSSSDSSSSTKSTDSSSSSSSTPAPTTTTSS